MFTLLSKIRQIVGRHAGRAIESMAGVRALAKRTAFAGAVAFVAFELNGIAAAAELGLAWNANPETDIANYRLSYGDSPGQYTQVRDVGRNTRALVSDLEAGRTYYFAVTAVNYAGMQSDPSAEISYQVPPVYYNLNLAWNPNPETDISAYRLSYGTSSGQYSQVLDAGRNTRATINNLEQGKTYYFVVTAVNYAGMASDPSDELVYNGAAGVATTSTFAGLLQASPEVISSTSGAASASDVLNSYMGGGSGFDALVPTAEHLMADPDGDGVSESYLLFSYCRDRNVAADTSIAAIVEISRDLASDWEDATNIPGVVVREEADLAGPGLDVVRVYLPSSLANRGRLFARLAVSKLAQ